MRYSGFVGLGFPAKFRKVFLILDVNGISDFFRFLPFLTWDRRLFFLEFEPKISNKNAAIDISIPVPYTRKNPWS